ncbi:MAG TPA: glycoside hydrolase family 43 protein [Anaerolineae bacterium]
MLTNLEINIRDPFVVPVPTDQRYYLFGTRGQDCWEGNPAGFDVYIGGDLQHWDGPHPAFRPAPGFWADRNYWAPEVHAYKGRYYMFASFKAENVCRGTQILAADTPAGPYQPLTERPVTPADWECLDGTLYVDEQNAPWIVFCHEWVQVHDGEICALRLSGDLRQPIGEPRLLFHASEAPWITPYSGQNDFVTDGPFLHRAQNGELLLLWSSFTNGSYTLGVARSLNGGIGGPWQQDAEPLYREDGGHGMLFRTFEGQLMLTVHRPNSPRNERPIFVPLAETNGRLSIA